MAKKTNKNIQPVEGVFSNRPRVRKVVEEPVELTIEPEVEDTVEEPTTESTVIIEENEQDLTHVRYNILNIPLGSKENGIVLTIILLCLLIVSLLGFLIYYEYSWRQQEQGEVQVETKFDALTNVVKTYVATINDSNKGGYCSKLNEVYLEASKSSDDINDVEAVIREKSRDILGFNNPKESSTNEYEWQKLLGSTGVINTWLLKADVIITKENQQEVFTAIAKGFE